MDRQSDNPLGKSAAEKLAQPKLLSNYQKERIAQENKKREEEAANAAALRDFENEFGVEQDARDRHPSGQFRPSSGPQFVNGPGRHSGYNDHRQGPGPARFDPGPPMSMKRKRQLEDQKDREAAYSESADWQDQSHSKRAREAQREDRPAAGPVVFVSDLPPNFQANQLRVILSPYVTVQSISFRAPTKGAGGKRSTIATVQLAAGTTSTAIDGAIDKLRNHYIGFGYTISISRSAPMANLHPRLSGQASDQPFGAQQVHSQSIARQAGPYGGQNRFAPPDSYDSRRTVLKDMEVNLNQTLDLNTLRAIHRLADEFLALQKDQASRAMELEALLMRLPEVQNDPNFAFLYDSKSLAGLYYRYCLWAPTLDLLEELPSFRLFEDKPNLVFQRPTSKATPFNTLTDLSKAIDDPDYGSSEEEGEGEEHQAPPHERLEGLRTTLSPLHRARFAHLLARLPLAKTMLRHGDVARVTNFAISHAATGIDDIVDMMILNVTKPFSLLSIAGGDMVSTHKQGKDDNYEDYDPEDPLPSIEDDAHTGLGSNTIETRPTDPSGAMFVGLLIISDILGAIHTADGAKNAWKFRQLLEQGLRLQKIFEHLGQLDREFAWGKLTADMWKRRVDALFDIWNAQLCFSKDVVDSFRAAFHHERIEVASKKTTAETKVPAWRTAKPKAVPAGHIRRLEGGTVDAAEFAKAYAKLKSKSPSAQPDMPSTAVEQDAGSKQSSSPSRSTRPGQESTSNATGPPGQAGALSVADHLGQSQPPVSKKRLRAEDMFADDDW